jgi:AraC-like DNA-binding protein
MTQQRSEPGIKWLQPAKLPGVELLIAEKDQTAWRHFHERYAFSTAEIASADFRYRGKEGTCRDGTTMILEPGEFHRNLAVPQPQNFRVLFVDPVLFDTAGRESGLSATAHFRSALVADPHLMPAIYRLCAAVEAEETILEQQSRLAVCLRIALRHAEQPLPMVPAGRGEGVIERVKTYIHDRFNEPVTLNELTAVSGLSPFHLVRSFTKHVGLPPHAYQIHVRVGRGQSLLRAGATLAETASHVGFADQSHFTRHFKRIMKITPGTYARAILRPGSAIRES